MRVGINHLKAIIATVAAAISLIAPSASAQTISNTATIQWQVGPATLTQASNRIDLAVERPSAALSLSTFQFSGDANAQRLAVPTTICRGTGGDLPVILEGAYAGTPRDPASVERTTQIRAGEPLIIGITSASDNEISVESSFS